MEIFPEIINWAYLLIRELTPFEQKKHLQHRYWYLLHIISLLSCIWLVLKSRRIFLWKKCFKVSALEYLDLNAIDDRIEYFFFQLFSLCSLMGFVLDPCGGSIFPSLNRNLLAWVHCWKLDEINYILNDLRLHKKIFERAEWKLIEKNQLLAQPFQVKGQTGLSDLWSFLVEGE